MDKRYQDNIVWGYYQHDMALYYTCPYCGDDDYEIRIAGHQFYCNDCKVSWTETKHENTILFKEVGEWRQVSSTKGS